MGLAIKQMTSLPPFPFSSRIKDLINPTVFLNRCLWAAAAVALIYKCIFLNLLHEPYRWLNLFLNPILVPQSTNVYFWTLSMNLLYGGWTYFWTLLFICTMYRGVTGYLNLGGQVVIRHVGAIEWQIRFCQSLGGQLPTLPIRQLSLTGV